MTGRTNSQGSDSPPVWVAAIAGTGQNGGTLLCRLLGTLPGAVPIGEIAFLWDRALLGDLACGCGAPFRSCPFWTSVGDVAFGGWNEVDPWKMSRLRDATIMRKAHLSGLRAAPAMLAPRAFPTYEAALHRYGDVLKSLYAAILKVSGARVVVDSTKLPSHVAVLRGTGATVRMLHLVRDARGVAASGRKVVQRQVSIDGQAHRGRPSVAKSVAWWLSTNMALDLLAASGMPRVVIDYQRLVTDPVAEIRRAGAFCGLATGQSDFAFIDGTRVTLPVHHLVAGNRLRFGSDPFIIRADEAWRKTLTPLQQWLVGAATKPFDLRYRRGAVR